MAIWMRSATATLTASPLRNRSTFSEETSA
jgi:hypothetical protein